MEFQNQPFQDLKGRVGWLESRVYALEEMVESFTAEFGARGKTEPEKVCEEQDAAGGKPLFKAVEEVQEKNEG